MDNACVSLTGKKLRWYLMLRCLKSPRTPSSRRLSPGFSRKKDITRAALSGYALRVSTVGPIRSACEVNFPITPRNAFRIPQVLMLVNDRR